MGKKILAAQTVADGLPWPASNPVDLLMENPSPADLEVSAALSASYDYSEVAGIVAVAKPGTAQIIKTFVFKEGPEAVPEGSPYYNPTALAGRTISLMNQWARAVASISRQVSAGTGGITVDTDFDLGYVASDGTFTTLCVLDTCQAAESSATAWDTISLQGFPSISPPVSIGSAYRLALRVSLFAWMSTKPGAETGDIRLYVRRNTFDTMLEVVVV